MMLNSPFQKLLTCSRECFKNSPKIIGSSIPLLSALLIIFLTVTLAKRQNDNVTTNLYFQSSAQSLPVIMTNEMPSLHHRLAQSTGWHGSLISQRKNLADNSSPDNNSLTPIGSSAAASTPKTDQQAIKTSTATTKTEKIIDHTVNMSGFVEANAVSSDEHGEIILSNEDKSAANPVTTADKTPEKSVDTAKVLGSNAIDTTGNALSQEHVE